MSKPNAANGYTTTLNGALNNSATTFSVNDAVPAELVVPFRVRLVAEGANTNEIAFVIAMSGTGNKDWTVIRGYEAWNGSSSASAHASGATVEHNFTAGTLADALVTPLGFIGVAAYNSADLTISTSGEGNMTMDSNLFDTDGFHSISSNTQRFTVPTGLGGKYLVGVHARVNSNADLYVIGRKNGSTIVVFSAQQFNSTNAFGIASDSALVDLSAGDYIEFKQLGTTSSIKASGGHQAWAWMYRVDSGRNTGGNYILVEDKTLAATATSVTFTVPSSYAHLRIFVSARSDRSGQVFEGVDIQFNGDTGSNYDSVNPDFNNSGGTFAESIGGTAGYLGSITGATATASRVGSFEVSIPNYSGTTFHKGYVVNNNVVYGTSTGNVHTVINSGLWRDTSGITSVTIKTRNGSNFIAGSRFTVYAIAVSPSTVGPQATYLGYNTVGGSYEAVSGTNYYAKQITPTQSGIIMSMGAYIKGDGTHAATIGTQIVADSSGAPSGTVLHATIAPYSSGSAALNTFISSTARWIDIPVGLYVTAGTSYWLVFALGDGGGGGNGAMNIAYDTGSDYKWAPGSTYYIRDASPSYSNNSRKYSFRALFSPVTLV